MGIRQLQTFILNYVPNGYTEVSLIDECEAFKRTNNERPILLFDVMALCSPLLPDHKEMLCGLRCNEIYKILEELLQKLSSVADLVFFQDGILTEEKLPVFMDRQDSSYETSQKIFEKVYQNFSLEEIISTEESCVYQTPCQILEFLAKKYGILKVALVKECDSEMAQYAFRNPRALAIMSDDTDFLIFPGTWRSFSLRELDLKSLKTIEYSRKALREELQLDDKELVLLSTLNGNDFISFDENFRFHKSVTKQPRNPAKRFPALAAFIKENQLLHSNNLIKQLTFTIFRGVTKELLQKVRHSVEFYNIEFKAPQIIDESMIFAIENDLEFVYSRLNNMPVTVTYSYIDIRQPINCFKKMNDLILKLIGIVLKFKPYRRYKICTKTSHEQSYAIKYMYPIVPNDYTLPPLIELLDRATYPQHDEIRFNLLKWITTQPSSHVNLMSIPQKYFTVIVVLMYMVSDHLISAIEADIILLSVKKVDENDVPEDIHVPETFDPRAFGLPFLFKHCFTYIDCGLSVIGLSELSRINRFDGVLFHNLYKQYSGQPLQVIELLGDLSKYRYYG